MKPSQNLMSKWEFEGISFQISKPRRQIKCIKNQPVHALCYSSKILAKSSSEIGKLQICHDISSTDDNVCSRPSDRPFPTSLLPRWNSFDSSNFETGEKVAYTQK